MDAGVLYLVLAILAFGLALELKLSLAAVEAARHLASAGERQPTPPQDEVIPAVSGRTLIGRMRTHLPADGMPTVLLFLSSTCPKCRQKLPEIASFLPHLDDAGLRLWLVSREPRWRLRRFLRDSALAPHALCVNMSHFKALNPTLSSPFYLFVDERGRLQAGGMIGDENWQGFRQQMQEFDSEREAA